MILYLSVEQALELHAILLDAFGGAAEIRDRGRAGTATSAALLHFIVLNKARVI
ncbi:MAG TPA: hypothetical protein VLK65_29560 [Vicinamibacteria bacterium]|nr:hypothetical protein [Vicinamibacteria bacterium]